jgi:hypothetical protein
MSLASKHADHVEGGGRQSARSSLRHVSQRVPVRRHQDAATAAPTPNGMRSGQRVATLRPVRALHLRRVPAPTPVRGAHQGLRRVVEADARLGRDDRPDRHHRVHPHGHRRRRCSARRSLCRSTGRSTRPTPTRRGPTPAARSRTGSCRTRVDGMLLCDPRARLHAVKTPRPVARGQRRTRRRCRASRGRRCARDGRRVELRHHRHRDRVRQPVEGQARTASTCATRRLPKEAVESKYRNVTWKITADNDTLTQINRARATLASTAGAQIIASWTGPVLAGAATVFPSVTVTIPFARFDGETPTANNMDPITIAALGCRAVRRGELAGVDRHGHRRGDAVDGRLALHNAARWEARSGQRGGEARGH